MIIVMNAFAVWNPQALVLMRPMDTLLDSAIPLVSFHSVVASIDGRQRRMVRARFTNGASFERGDGLAVSPMLC